MWSEKVLLSRIYLVNVFIKSMNMRITVNKPFILFFFSKNVYNNWY